MVNGPPTYYDLIARDKEVVKSVLLLTGSVEVIKQQVAEYLAKFDKYSFLWTQDLQVRTVKQHLPTQSNLKPAADPSRCVRCSCRHCLLRCAVCLRCLYEDAA